MIVLADYALACFPLLPDNVAKNAALFLVVVMPAVIHLFAHSARNDGKSDQLRMRMLHRRARRFSMILEDQYIPKALVVLQIQHAVAIGPQNVFQRTFRQRSQRRRVVRRFDNHFMRADPVHLVEQSFAFLVQVAFDSQRGKFVRYHANRPACAIWASAISPVNQNFIRGFCFVPWTKWTILRIFGNHALAQEIHRPLSAIGRNNHPTASNRVLP